MSRPTQRTRRARHKDISIVLGTKKWSNSLGFVESAVVLGHFVSCQVCEKVLGVGLTEAAAADDATENKTGTFRDGAWLCADDLPGLTPAEKAAGLDGK